MLRTAVTACPRPAGICLSSSPDSDWSRVLFPFLARPPTPMLIVRLLTLARTVASRASVSVTILLRPGTSRSATVVMASLRPSAVRSSPTA